MRMESKALNSVQDGLNDLAVLACSFPQNAEEAQLLSEMLQQQILQVEVACEDVKLMGLAYTLQVLSRGLKAKSSQSIDTDNLEAITVWSTIAASYCAGQMQDAEAGAPMDALSMISILPPIPETMARLIREKLIQDSHLLSAVTEAASDIVDDAITDSLIADNSNHTDLLLGEENDFIIDENADSLNAEILIDDSDEALAQIDVVETNNDAIANTAGDGVQSDDTWISPEELELITQAIDEQLIPLALDLGGAADSASRQAVAENYSQQWGFIGSAFEAVGLSTLIQACADVSAMLDTLVADGSHEAQATLLANWPLMLAGYLQAPNELIAAQDLCSLLGDSAWPNPRSQAQIDALAEQLSSVHVGYDPRLKAQRKTQAEPEDVELKVADDVLPAVLDGMMRELPARAAEFTQMTQHIVRTGHPEAIDVARRIAHTLKGDGSIVGLRGIAVLTHSLEEIFIVLAKKPGIPVPALADVLIESADCLEGMSDHVLGRGPAPENALDVLQKVLNWDNALHGDDAVEAIASPPIEMTALHAEPLAENTEQPSAVSAPAASNAATVSAGPGATINVPAALLDQLLRMTGEAIIYSRQVETRARRLEQRTSEITVENKALQTLVNELQQLVEVHGSVSGSSQQAMGDQLDALEMERYNELHTVTNRLVEASTDARTTNLDMENELEVLKDLLVAQDRIHLELQEKMLATLSVPASGMIPRFQRIARQAARQVGKEIDIVVSGENTPIDHDVLDQLAEPMAHLLRNAVDHGLESNEEREFMGKPIRGTIHIDIGRDGNQVFIRCKDDGRGIDHEAIRQRAVERGLISNDDKLAEDEITRLIFRSGFSTRDEASEISGRGIGMDIVQRSIQRLKGSLSIQSTLGVGSSFDIRLPVSQVVANVTMVRTQAGWLAVSLQGIERLLSLSQADIDANDSGITVKVDDETSATAVHAESVFAINIPSDRFNRTAVPALLVNTGQGRCVVLVEELGESRTVIVKALNPYLPALAGVRGATILGDGTVAPVVDLGELLSKQSEDFNFNDIAFDSDENFALPSAMVVDDSLSVRRAMEQLLKDSGFEVRLARDGLEAVELIRERTPDIMLVDLEMPRMNGLELTAFVRNFEKTRQVPVIMITSRTTERHKELAQEAGVDLVITKPYTDENLLDAIAEQMSVRNA
jgi:chemotaxis protein histidine kinase CheA/ActR/RegA family two-component response regulator